MTDDPRELARRARVAKFEKLKQHAQITTAAELLAKHKLPASVAEIEAGEKPETTNGIISNRSFADGLYPVLARWRWETSP